MKIAFVASECVPYSKTGGLADVVGALPKALAGSGHQVQVIIPRYRGTQPGGVVPGGHSITIPLASGWHFASIQDGGTDNGVEHYLVDAPEFFDRQGLYQERGVDYPDNPVRFAAFSMAALEFLKRSAPAPDVIHCHDWQSAPVPAYLRSMYRRDLFFAKTAVVFTIHNLGYPGLFTSEVLFRASLDYRLFNRQGLEFFGKVNYLKGGIEFSDFVTTVSRKYAEEIQTPDFGFGLDGVLRRRSGRLRGILNGVDYEAWNPATDKLIAANYGPEDLTGKRTCKEALLRSMGVASPELDRPVIGIVSRFDKQKGFDLIAGIVEQLMGAAVYVVALGTGDPTYETFFGGMAERYPGKFLVRIKYDNALAHQIEAGSDMFLMPSRYEPSGLNQMYSLKYGTVPVVRATGGLDDSIEDFDGENGTGFKFSDYTPEALIAAIWRAVDCYYRSPEVWRRLVENGMRQDFSWPVSAARYVEVYQEAVRSSAR